MIHNTNNNCAEILCIGTELLLGNITNSNARWLSEELSSLGLPHYRQSVVGDNSERLIAAIKESSQRCQILITTGGLGPTQDDITTESLALAFGEKLEERKELWDEIQAKQAEKGGTFPISNRKQALAPPGALIISNLHGTAPGIIWRPMPGFTVLTFPGVPSELKQMWKDSAAKWLLKNIKVDYKLESKTLHFAGISESQLSEDVADMILQKNPTVAPYASLGEVKLRITARGNSTEEAKRLINPCEEMLRLRTGLLCYGCDNETLSSVVIELLRKRGETLAVAESCTGGLLGATLTAIPGASEVFVGGVIAYNNLIKEKMLSVSSKVLKEKGAVSNEVAKAMAQGSRKHLGADWAIAISGVAGPNGGTTEKPVGTVYLAIAGPKNCSGNLEEFGAHLGRNGIQQMSVVRSLDRLRMILLLSSD